MNIPETNKKYIDAAEKHVGSVIVYFDTENDKYFYEEDFKTEITKEEMFELFFKTDIVVCKTAEVDDDVVTFYFKATGLFDGPEDWALILYNPTAGS